MRIIAGSARGTPLLAPKGMDTRPTQDKVKESLFNMLQGDMVPPQTEEKKQPFWRKKHES